MVIPIYFLMCKNRSLEVGRWPNIGICADPKVDREFLAIMAVSSVTIPLLELTPNRGPRLERETEAQLQLTGLTRGKDAPEGRQVGGALGQIEVGVIG